MPSKKSKAFGSTAVSEKDENAKKISEQFGNRPKETRCESPKAMGSFKSGETGRFIARIVEDIIKKVDAIISPHQQNCIKMNLNRIQ